jgi:tripartite-type tricarboxylate transporter receptor subunit TctC
MPDLGLDVRTALAPLAPLVDYPSVFAVPAALAARSMPELLDAARRDPGAMNYGSMGNGSAPHLYVDVLQDLARMRMTHVPYRGMGPAFTDLVAGRLQLVVAAPPTVLGAVRAGTVRVLAIGTRGSRIPALPDAPTLRELGIDFAYSYWYGLFGPAGTDPATAARVLDAVQRINGSPEVQARFAGQGGVPLEGDGATLARLLGDEVERWTAVVRDKGITP